MAIAQLKTTNILRDWMTTINSIISSLGGFYTKDEMNDILYNGLFSTQYVWQADKDYEAESIITLDEFYYPANLNALIVSLDGFLLSYALQYEEVVSSDDIVSSNKIKIRVPVKKGMLINVWVAPVFANNGVPVSAGESAGTYSVQTRSSDGGEVVETQQFDMAGNENVIDEYSKPFNETGEDITVFDGNAGTAWTRIVRLTNVSTITLGSSWSWKDGVLPTIKEGGILICCWCGSGGIATFMSPSN